jgi:hypothetical protein
MLSLPRWSLLALAPLALLSAGCGADAPSTDEQDATATQYLDAETFWKTQPERDAWAQMITRMGEDFADICGDTFCGGDYSNLRPLDFTCAVSSKVGQIHDCLWTFAGTSELVNPATGALTVSKPSFQCHVKVNARASKLVEVLTPEESDSVIRRPLPGGTTSIYDAIGECFQHPLDASPLSPIYSKDPSYAVVGDAPATDGSWFSAERSFGQAFADACPGSFCKGPFDNLGALRLTCAVSITTGNIKSCAVMLAGSKPAVSTSKGTVSTDFKSYRCSLPMKGSPNALSAMILADDPTPMLDRPLPGSTKTARQALAGCL